jgi:hypothetical protein
VDFLKRIHTFAAVGIPSLIATVVLSPAALAAGGVRAGASTAAGLPTTHIEGKPAKFSPSKLTVKDKLTGTTCTKSQASFDMLNNENTAETVKFYVHGGLFRTETVAAHKGQYICSKKGLRYQAIGKLSDGKKLTVTFT